MRVNADHWNVLLDFAEINPSIITNRFPGVKGKENHTELWKVLSNKLNSLGYGEKTTSEWKKTLIDWKSKVKAKAGGIKSYESQTGGGPSCNQQLSSLEIRLLSLMGSSSYEGNPENIEVGLKKRKLNDIPHVHSIPGKPKLIIFNPNKAKPLITSDQFPSKMDKQAFEPSLGRQQKLDEKNNLTCEVLAESVSLQSLPDFCILPSKTSVGPPTSGLVTKSTDDTSLIYSEQKYNLPAPKIINALAPSASFLTTHSNRTSLPQTCSSFNVMKGIT